LLFYVFFYVFFFTGSPEEDGSESAANQAPTAPRFGWFRLNNPLSVMSPLDSLIHFCIWLGFFIFIFLAWVEGHGKCFYFPGVSSVGMP
jgi:hypothetical protein